MLLTVEKVTKYFGKLKALDEVTFSVSQGEVIGLLGHNGAGKSTLIRCLMGAIQSYTGVVRIAGQDARKDHSQVMKNCGFLLEPVFCDYLSARKNLELLNSLSNKADRQRINGVLELVSLKKAGDQKVAEFSFGMKQRLGLAQVLLTEPRLIVLDEPTVGLDPLGVDVIKQLILDLSNEGTAILFSSHELNNVFDICSRSIVMNIGDIVFDGPVATLTQKLYTITCDTTTPIPSSALQQFFPDASIATSTVSFVGSEMINPLLNLLIGAGCTILDINCEHNLNKLKHLLQR